MKVDDRSPYGECSNCGCSKNKVGDKILCPNCDYAAEPVHPTYE